MEIVISFIEILGMFLIHNVLFNNSVVKDIAIKILHIIISISIYSLFINFYKVNNSISFVTIIFLNCLLFHQLKIRHPLLKMYNASHLLNGWILYHSQYQLHLLKHLILNELY